MDIDQYLINQLNNKFTCQPVSIHKLIVTDIRDYHPQDFFSDTTDTSRVKECYVLTSRAIHQGKKGYWEGCEYPDGKLFGNFGVVGVKQKLRFYEGDMKNRYKTNWYMIEYRLLHHYCLVMCNHLEGRLFSLLDTQSLCYAAVSCSMFQKCAMDLLCYANVDLTTVVPKINNAVVSTMIRRAGKSLKSLKLGLVPSPISSPRSCQPLDYSIRNSVDISNFSWNDKKTRQGKESSVLTRSCLIPLSGKSSAAGHVELRQTLVSVSMNCPLMERLFF